MGIKGKKPGARPNTPTFEYEWQQIAYSGRVEEAKRAYRQRFAHSTPVEALRAVKAFMQNHRVAVKVG